jgi:hypothetical protein
MTSPRLTPPAIAALALASALLVAGCGTRTATPAEEPLATTSDAGGARSGATTPAGPDLGTTAERIKALGESTGATRYAGLALDHDTSIVRVWRVPGNDALDRALQGAAAPGVAVSLEAALHSGRELTQIRDDIMAQFGSEVVGAAVPPDGSAVEVTVPADHVGLTTKIEQLGPIGTVKVRIGEGGPT